MEQKQFATRLGGVVTLSVDHDRDGLLTDFGKATLKDRYLLPGERPQDLFARVAAWYSNDNDHAARLYDYISRMWFMPATPVLSNGGTSRGNPISCFLNEVSDDLEGIDDIWSENTWLAARGGGIGTYWGNVRGMGERVGLVGESSGIIPFVKVMDSMTLAISQGSLRRGSAAVYIDIDHPEIVEFLDLRRPTGDQNRRSLNLHHGVCIPDRFMQAVERGEKWNLISPSDGSVRGTVDARELWQKLLLARIDTGEPYLLFIDTVNRSTPEHQRRLGLKVSTSNLCSEITLATGPDHLGNRRTAVCCLSSLNAEYAEEWRGNRQFLKDCLLFLDNVLQDFIDRTKGERGFDAARYAAERERSIGLGVMGFHSFLQSKNVPIESSVALGFNKWLFSWLKKTADEINTEVAFELGACPDSDDAIDMAQKEGVDQLPPKRWSNIFAIAPTASISIIAQNTSPCIEPYPTNAFTQKTLSGSFGVRNRHLHSVLESHALSASSLLEPDEVPAWIEEQWASIIAHQGSVQHLPYLTDDQKAVFKTAFEIDQRWLIWLAADRTPFICQAASNNIWLPPDASVHDLHHLHFMAWKRGLKSLYYLRSRSIQRAEAAVAVEASQETPANVDYDECLACQ
jgi:ribonucleoside-diphosphate reductase alpha chain